MKFADIPGLADVKDTLRGAVQNNHVAHAQLLLSKQGGGALPLAIAYATYLNCENLQPGDADSCGTCPSCYKFGKLIHPDMHFVFPTATTKQVSKRDEAVSSAFMAEWREFVQKSPYGLPTDWANAFGAEGKQCIIPVAEGRNIIKSLALKAFDARYKIMLIWQPELMNISAANAILKILEEPPESTVFLLVAHQIDQMLPTILSRTQLISVRPFTDDEIARHLAAQRHLGEAKAHQIALLADGSLGEALHLAEEQKDVGQDIFQQWMRHCFKPDLTALVKEAEKFGGMDKEGQKGLLQYGLAVLRQSLLCRFGSEAQLRLAPEALAFVRNFAKVVNERNLAGLASAFNAALHHLERNVSPRMIFLDLSLQAYQLLKLK